MNDARRTRAAARRDWPVSAHQLEESQPAHVEGASARVASVWRITLDTWALSGRSLPEYERAEMLVQIRQLIDG